MKNSAASDPSDDADNPELTDKDIARMRPAREAMSPAAYAQLTGLSEVGLTLPTATVQAFVEQGGDWKARMAQTLNEAARKKSAA